MANNSERTQAGTTLDPEIRPIQSLLFHPFLQKETVIAATVGLLGALIMVASTNSDLDFIARGLM